jgi:hypothetical protein
MQPPQNQGKADEDGEAQADKVPQGVDRFLEKAKVPGNIRIVGGEEEKHLENLQFLNFLFCKKNLPEISMVSQFKS